MKKHYLIILFLILYFVVIAYKLVYHVTPFYDWDESINAEVGKEMIHNRSLVPLWQGNFWLDKPPFPFLLFGSIMKLTPFIMPEISLRIAALGLSIIALIFIYLLVEKAIKDHLISFLTVVLVSFTPIFLQRSQILNLDVFLIIGWLGYLLFFENYFLSLFFLIVAVLTKSLVGFYPIGIMFIYYGYLLLFKKINREQFLKVTIKLISHVVILSLWYFAMLLEFGKLFWQQHIIESHFRRVTSSIESHFGKKTYYLDLLIEQMGIFFWTSIIGLLFLILNFLRRKLTAEKLIYSLFLFPWFIFLNLTKTKIFWYLYPSIPQFAYLAVLPLKIFNKQKTIYYLLGFFILIIVIYGNFVKNNFFNTYYSSYEDHYYLATYAKNTCNELAVLVGKDARNTQSTLEKLGLTITSTKQWGDHPSLVYYFGRKVNFYYDKNIFRENLSLLSDKDCTAVNKEDLDVYTRLNKFESIKTFGQLYLYKRI